MSVAVLKRSREEKEVPAEMAATLAKKADTGSDGKGVDEALYSRQLYVFGTITITATAIPLVVILLYGIWYDIHI